MLVSAFHFFIMIDYLSIISEFYKEGDPDHHILLTHSTQVAKLTRQLCSRFQANGGEIDAEFAFEAAMLHDIGICHTYAPGIYCCGKEPYIKHGILGRQMLEQKGLHRHALVCERHTGAGISLADIQAQHLDLPQRDMLPVSLEEKVVCYADKFFSKSRITEYKTLDRARTSLAKFGEASLVRFSELIQLFGEPDFSQFENELR